MILGRALCSVSLNSINTSLIELNRSNVLLVFLAGLFTSWWIMSLSHRLAMFKTRLLLPQAETLYGHLLKNSISLLAVCLDLFISWRTKKPGIWLFSLIWPSALCESSGWPEIRTLLLHLSSWILTYCLTDLGLSWGFWVLSKLPWLYCFHDWRAGRVCIV